MKKRFETLLLVAAALCATACGMDQFDTPEQPEEQQPGYLTIGEVDLNADTEVEAIDDKKKGSAPQTRVNAGDDYWVTVTNATTQAIAWEGNYGDLFTVTGSTRTPRPIELQPGEYHVAARQSQSGEIAAVAESAPYYAGSTKQPVKVESQKTASASVTCKLANIKTSVMMTADLCKAFKYYEDKTNNARLKTEIWLNDSRENNWNFNRESTHDAPLVYFRDEAGLGKDNTMHIVLSGEYYTGDPADLEEGGTVDESLYKFVTMEKTITNVRAAQWHKITIAIDHNTSGDVKFVVTIESYVYDDTIDVDVTTLYMAVEETIDDDEEVSDPDAPKVTIQGDEEADTFVIDETIYDADIDAWTSYLRLNVAPAAGATVEGLYAVITSDNEALMTAVAQQFGTTRAATDEIRIALAPENAAATYCTFNKTANTLSMKPAGMSAFWKYEGTHTVKIVATDNLGRKSYTPLKVQVEKGSTPPTPGEGPTVVWVGNDIDKRFTLTAQNYASTQCKIQLTSATGLTGLSVDIISDVLTPEELAGVGLGAHMDLMNPGEYEENLRNLGFLPADGSSLMNQKDVSFEITSFLSMLYMLYNTEGDCDFLLKATDSSGTTTKTVMFHIQK